MKTLIGRIAGVGFVARFPIVSCDPGGVEVIDPSLYTWTLRGRKSDAPAGEPAFELSTANGAITIEPIPESDQLEVVCTFTDDITAGLDGLYLAQLVGSRDGDRVLGAELDPFRFTALI